MDYEIRKSFEAAIADVAKQYGLDHDTLRLEIKAELIAMGVIDKSTNELSDEDLKIMANNLIQVHYFNDTHPPLYKLPLDVRSFIIN